MNLHSLLLRGVRNSVYSAAENSRGTTTNPSTQLHFPELDQERSLRIRNVIKAVLDTLEDDGSQGSGGNRWNNGPARD